MAGGSRLIIAGCAGSLTDGVIEALEARNYTCEFVDLACETPSVIDAILSSGRVDGLVNLLAPPSNLGVSQTDFLSQCSRDWRRVLDIDVYGILDVTRAVLAHMCLHRSGSIVSVTSNVGLRGVPGLNAYSAAHAGIQMFTQSMAQDCAEHGVRINCIIAGEHEFPARDAAGNYREPPLGPGKYGPDVGAAAAFLLSGEASHITGSCIDVSGGWSLS